MEGTHGLLVGCDDKQVLPDGETAWSSDMTSTLAILEMHAYVHPLVIC